MNTTDTSPTTGEDLYGYVPTQSVTIIFLALFSISTIAHAGQAITYRMWFLFPTAFLCGIFEVVGWGARLWSSISPELTTPFIIQVSGTILGPTPLVAANFIILGRIIAYLGPIYSRLTPKQYSIVFLTGDIFSLLVQSAGGGISSSASNGGGNAALGGTITLVGMAFQMTMITLYVLSGAEFFIRYFKKAPVRKLPRVSQPGAPPHVRGYMDKHLRRMCIALVFSTTCLFTRAVYRAIELADGWDGRIAKTQLYFNLLDGMLIVFAMYTLNVAHPGYLLDDAKREGGGKYTNTNSMELERGVRDTESMRPLA
ncbi:Uncharacterized protein C17G6.02c [Hypsizygus marmoreus]|uniref:Uncharacterized protein C17G6.02c n=1 Tax=Hypsizygus marmoreus TaxID=39966 RepID=A0A369K3X1_HYPMA|nr:Uncharacterized protein C17G6.02c [Hypsizygus marmoreus]